MKSPRGKPWTQSKTGFRTESPQRFISKTEGIPMNNRIDKERIHLMSPCATVCAALEIVPAAAETVPRRAWRGQCSALCAEGTEVSP